MSYRILVPFSRAPVVKSERFADVIRRNSLIPKAYPLTSGLLALATCDPFARSPVLAVD